jgi:tetratricopeptide (TPR) repeat protein
MSRRSPPPAAPSSNFRRRRWWIYLSGGIVITLASWWGWQRFVEPQLLYREAQQLLASHPQRSAELLEAAVSLRGGSFPAAELLWTRALLQCGQREEAAGCFSLIKEPGRLPARELLELADEAMQARLPLLATLALAAIPPGDADELEALRRLVAVKLSGGGDLREVLDRAVDLEERAPKFPEGPFHAAIALEQLGNPLEAAAAWERYLQFGAQLEPAAQATAWQHLLRLQLQLGEYAAAKNSLQKLGTLRALTPDDLLYRVRILRGTGEIDAAWEQLCELRDAVEDRGAWLELSGTIALDRRDYATAEEAFRNILRVQPWNSTAHYQLALVLQQTGRDDSAQEHFAENRRLSNLSVRVLELQGMVTNNPSDEQQRLKELAAAHRTLGQFNLATRVEQRLQQLQRNQQR